MHLASWCSNPKDKARLYYYAPERNSVREVAVRGEWNALTLGSLLPASSGGSPQWNELA